MKCPCMGCEAPKRTITCHITGNCEAHDKWKAEQDEIKEKRKLIREAENTQSERATRMITKALQKRRRMGG